MAEVKLRANQRDGFVFEAYAVASSKVENIKRLAKHCVSDPERGPRLDEIYRRVRNLREAARKRLDPFEEICADLYDTRGMDRKEIDALLKERDKLVGEIFAKLYRIDIASQAARNVLGG